MQPWQRPSALIISDFTVILAKVIAERKQWKLFGEIAVVYDTAVGNWRKNQMSYIVYRRGLKPQIFC